MFKAKPKTIADARTLLIERVDRAVNDAIEAKLDRRVLAEVLERFAEQLKIADAIHRPW